MNKKDLLTLVNEAIATNNITDDVVYTLADHIINNMETIEMNKEMINEMINEEEEPINKLEASAYMAGQKVRAGAIVAKKASIDASKATGQWLATDGREYAENAARATVEASKVAKEWLATDGVAHAEKAGKATTDAAKAAGGIIKAFWKGVTSK